MSLPYVSLLQGRDPLTVLRETPDKVAALLKQFSPEAIDASPAPGKWSLREILCHLADCEIAWAWRMRQIYAGAGGTLQSFDQDQWAKAYGYPGYSASAAMAAWVVSRQWNMKLLEGLSESEKQRTGTHPQHGLLSLWDVVSIAAGHDLHHLRGLEQTAASPHSS